MEWIHVALVLSTLLCSLVAGLVFAFAVIVMPGIRTLGDHEFLQAFKVMDRVIQDNNPLFMLVWLGSAVVLMASALLGIWNLTGADRLLVVIACAVFILGVQLPTVSINIPLNNRLQSQALETLTGAELRGLRERFEARWVRWNSIRTVAATLTTILLIIVLLST
jgi:uncharacterized membrane protein